MLEKQQDTFRDERVLLLSQQAKAEDALAALNDNIEYFGSAKVLELIGDELTKNTLPQLGQLRAYLNTDLPVRFPVNVQAFDELKIQCINEGLRIGNNVVRFLEPSKRSFILLPEWICSFWGALSKSAKAVQTQRRKF
ncbi:hypothetical protein BASA81_005563 [Batrachochytrium salamandrivorans]|nr:hypothetical protein BASA81_005563 [Batrachochytrium salamandrivorans]